MSKDQLLQAAAKELAQAIKRRTEAHDSLLTVLRILRDADQTLTQDCERTFNELSDIGDALDILLIDICAAASIDPAQAENDKAVTID